MKVDIFENGTKTNNPIKQKVTTRSPVLQNEVRYDLSRNRVDLESARNPQAKRESIGYPSTQDSNNTSFPFARFFPQRFANSS